MEITLKISVNGGESFEFDADDSGHTGDLLELVAAAVGVSDADDIAAAVEDRNPEITVVFPDINWWRTGVPDRDPEQMFYTMSGNWLEIEDLLIEIGDVLAENGETPVKAALYESTSWSEVRDRLHAGYSVHNDLKEYAEEWYRGAYGDPADQLGPLFGFVEIDWERFGNSLLMDLEYTDIDGEYVIWRG